VVQELLGHSQISVTIDVYSRLMPGQREQAVSALATALGR
jgi:site-specific recombinase XerD